VIYLTRQQPTKARKGWDNTMQSKHPHSAETSSQTVNNDEIKKQITKAILEGRVESTPRFTEAVESMDLKNPDFTITNVVISFWSPNEHNGGGMKINWSTKSAGCGSATFCNRKDGKLHCDNETMDKEFLTTLFDFILEHTELDQKP